MENMPIYFFISYTLSKKENPDDIEFIVPDKKDEKPQCIYSNETTMDDNKYLYKKIFKANESLEKRKKSKKSSEKEKKDNNYDYEFQIFDNRYGISLGKKRGTFILDISLETWNKYLVDDNREKINQNIVDYGEKMNLFKEALVKNKEENKIEELYRDAIDLYSKNKSFALLVELFTNVYQNRNLCPRLFERFRYISQESNDKEKNIDRKPYLEKYKPMFIEISSNADELIHENHCNIIDFYGIILCYLNCYDIEQFNTIMEKLSKKQPEYLYEMLLIYSVHFINPINLNDDFYHNFIQYCLSLKNLSCFKAGLRCINDLEVFVNILEKEKEFFYENDDLKDENIIKVDDNFKLKTPLDSEENNKNHDDNIKYI